MVLPSAVSFVRRVFEVPGRAGRFHRGFTDLVVEHRRHAEGFSWLHLLSVHLLVMG